MSKSFFRPAEVEVLIGDAQKAKKHLKWESHVSVKELAKMMVLADLDRVLDQREGV